MGENDVKSEERCGWTKFSETKLIELEKKILKIVKTAYKTWFVPIGPNIGNDDKIWTILLNEDAKKTPLVLLHGFAAGLGFWCLNFDSVAKERPVYAIDLLGFGHSSRPTFSNDSEEAEQQMVDSLEAWRKQVNLENFILLGHSFGGYLATSYAMNYPQRVKHLILADPWGFGEQPAKLEASLWIKTLRILLYPLTHFNPLATVRVAGPIGPWLVRKVRNDISEKYAKALENKDLMAEYIYQCNSQHPSGETAFHNMLKGVAFAKHPMVNRFHKLTTDMPITIIFGENSWITKTPGYLLKEQRPESVNIEIIENAGHHLNADQPTLFNEVVANVCRLSDKFLENNPTEELEESEEKINEKKRNGENINNKIRKGIDNDETINQINLIRIEKYNNMQVTNNSL